MKDKLLKVIQLIGIALFSIVYCSIAVLVIRSCKDLFILGIIMIYLILISYLSSIIILYLYAKIFPNVYKRCKIINSRSFIFIVEVELKVLGNEKTIKRISFECIPSYRIKTGAVYNLFVYTNTVFSKTYLQICYTVLLIWGILFGFFVL